MFTINHIVIELDAFRVAKVKKFLQHNKATKFSTKK